MRPIDYNNTTYYLSLDENSLKKILYIQGDYSSFKGVLDGGRYCMSLLVRCWMRMALG